MGMTPTADRTARRSTSAAPPRRAPGRRPRRTLRGVAVLAVLVPATVLAGCGQGSSGAGASAPEPPPTQAAPSTGDAMDPSDPTDPTAPTGPAEPSGTPGQDPVPSGAPGATLPRDPAGADLVLVVGPAGAQQPPVTLACDWAGGTSSGTHPQAAQACADLLRAIQAGDPFAPVAPDAMCTQQYGGDAVVELSGTVLAADGAPVDVAGTYTLTDGCQIARFEAVGALLAPYRGSV